ncbi:MAG: NAD(P)H-dependent glycerol-3-phosphate dehydrogenase [Balneolaceae bacterium]|nr:MAG: NAD(P)H-dependent glycerol-3-phosphate dehydrogenase [Balneolaceae bacterium]
MKVTIVGAGSWGTALSLVLHQGGHEVRIWAREPEVALRINQFRDNQDYLPGVSIPEGITCCTGFEDCLPGCDVVVFATPSHAMREVAGLVKPFLKGTEILVHVAKGIENETFMTMSQVLTEVLSDVIPEDHIGVLSGPSHSEEVSRMKATTVVSAANSKSTATLIQKLFMTPHFRVYVNHDIKGVEIAGSVKNVMAIAAGIVDGAKMGDNASAALMTRGLLEMKRLGTRLGASQDTFSGLAGIGDLIVTCTSKHSRNRYVGFQIGQGMKLNDIIANMNMVAEGVKTTRSVYEWSKKLNVNMPLTEAVYQVLFEDVKPFDALANLMTRDPKDEILV